MFLYRPEQNRRILRKLRMTVLLSDSVPAREAGFLSQRERGSKLCQRQLFNDFELAVQPVDPRNSSGNLDLENLLGGQVLH